jgi:integrase
MYDLCKQKFEPYKVRIGDSIRWQVNLESEYRVRPEGKRVRVRPRRTFSSAEEARLFARLKRVERENHGTAGVSMDEKLRGDTLEAQRILAPFGVTVLDAAKYYALQMRRLTESETVSTTVKALLEAKSTDNLRPRYLKDLRLRLSRFALSFGDRKLADIQPAEIDAWLRSLCLAPLGRNSYRLRLNMLFEFGRKCGWTVSNPVSEVGKAKVRESLPGILSPEQVARILESAGEDTVPYWALAFFAGLRSAELEKLSWEDIDQASGLITVPSNTSKTASRRYVSIRPNLAQWIESYRDRRGAVCPPNLRHRLEEDRTRAGIKTWFNNGARHSFASYHLSHFRDPKELALSMGHTRPDTLYRFYHQRVKPAEAEKFWRIIPAVQSETITAVA